MALVVKNPPANAGDIRDTGSIPGSGRSSAGGHGKPLQYSCLENPYGQRSLVGCSSQGHRVGHNSAQHSMMSGNVEEVFPLAWWRKLP